MEGICYVLFSPKLNRYYVGSTRHAADVRLEHHLAHLYAKNVFTAKTNDWQVFFTIECERYEQSLTIEKHIKKMKSASYIQNLKKYPEMVEKLKLKYR